MNFWEEGIGEIPMVKMVKFHNGENFGIYRLVQVHFQGWGYFQIYGSIITCEGTGNNLFTRVWSKYFLAHGTRFSRNQEDSFLS